MTADRVLGLAGTALRGTCDVIEASGAAGTLKQLATGSPFDVVVIECECSRERPTIGACVALVKTIFRRWPWTPVILIGEARATERLRGEVLVSGVRDILPKSFAPGDLVRSVAQVARRDGTRVPGVAAVASIRGILAFLDDHGAENPSLRQLAAMTTMSRSHFSRTFHAVAGMSLRAYVRNLRLSRAYELLVGSRLSLTTVAIDSGFYDLPHFDKVFRQRLGSSPQAFRRRQARGTGDT